MADHTFARDAEDHPSIGGKSLANFPAMQQPDEQGQVQVQGQSQGQPAPLERVPYKSWRKKYRKMRAHFDVIFEENKRLFKEEQRLLGTAKRLREELDGILDLLVDLNDNPALPPELRYDVRLPSRHPPPIDVPANITPEVANQMVMEYKVAVQQGSLPPLDLHVVRGVIEQTLAAQGTETLDQLINRVTPTPLAELDNLPPDVAGDDPPAFLTTEQETEHLARLDAKLGDSLRQGEPSTTRPGSSLLDDKHLAEMTPRELERYLDLLNPQSQHNWLKKHHKLGSTAADMDDNESLASHEPKVMGTGRKRGPGTKTLAKQIGDRALERAQKEEVWSPGAQSARDVDEEDIDMLEDYSAGMAAKKRGRDGDGAYRPKGGKSGGSSKAKRKRSNEGTAMGGIGGSGTFNSVKRARMDGAAE